MFDTVSLQWLQSIESNLQMASADLTVAYEGASHDEKPPIYMALAKLNERLRTVHGAIIDLVQERIRFSPPSAATIAQTQNLADRLQWLIGQANQYSAILVLLSDLSTLITKTVLHSPAVPQVADAVPG
jgi:hypothetical protein